MKPVIAASVMAILFLLITLSCSSGNGVVHPDSPGQLDNPAYETLPILVSDYDSHGQPSSGWGVLGLFSLSGNPENGDIELSSLRSSSLFDTLEVVDITNFLLLVPCTDCVKVKSFELTSDNLVQVNISIKHPFPAGDPFKPISGKNRADLHVFNVEGIVLATVDTETPVSFPRIGQTVGNTHLVNADGFTSYLDPILDNTYSTVATIHPYKLHFRDYSQGNFDPISPTGFSDIIRPTGNLVMAMGCEPDTQPYIFNLTDTSRLDFILAVGCTYSVSASSKSKRFVPEYRIPQHNKKAASEVHVEIIENNLRGEITDSDCLLHVKVLDMNHGVSVGDGLDQMHATSDVSTITLEVPGVTTDPVIVTNPVLLSGSGRNPDDPLTYEVSFMNTAGGVMGAYTGLVKVLDSYAPGQNSSPLLNGQDGITRVGPIENPLTGLFSIPEFATYSAFIVNVATGTDNPVCDIQSNPTGPNIYTNQNLTLDGSGSYDPDGTIESYEWDYQYDGVNFDVDGTGPVVLTSFPIAGNYKVALRLTDNLNAVSICTRDFIASVSDFIQIDDIQFGMNVVIVEDYNAVLHAFYGNPAEYGDQNSDIKWAYSTDHGNTWQGQQTLYSTSGTGNWHVASVSYNIELVMAYASDGPVIYITWLENLWNTSATDYTQRIMAGKVDIANLSAPSMQSLVVRTGVPGWVYNNGQIIETHDHKIMMYFLEVVGWGNFSPSYKFANSFDELTDAATPTESFTGRTTNAWLMWIYNSSAPILLTDSHNNILFTISGNIQNLTNPNPPPIADYTTNYGSVICRYNNSGDYSTGDNWTVTQHYGRAGSYCYWDNSTQAFCVDNNDNVHWVFEYEADGWGSWCLEGGDYSLVYGTGPSTGEWNFTYTDPVHPEMWDSGPYDTAEFIYANIDTNSEGEIWITYQDALNLPEIYYTWFDGSTWQDPAELTVPPMDSGYYPYMFISSWDAMYVVFADAPAEGDPWLKAINTL